MDERTRGGEADPTTNEDNNVKRDNSQPTDNQAQAGTQQDMNSQAQQQSASNPVQQKMIRVGNQDVPYFPAPSGDASDSITRNAQRAAQQTRLRPEDVPPMPESAKPEAALSARMVTMPGGGLQQLVDTYFPTDNPDERDAKIQDILNLNRDTLRNDAAHIPGQMVRIPQ